MSADGLSQAGVAKLVFGAVGLTAAITMAVVLTDTGNQLMERRSDFKKLIAPRPPPSPPPPPPPAASHGHTL